MFVLLASILNELNFGLNILLLYQLVTSPMRSDENRFFFFFSHQFYNELTLWGTILLETVVDIFLNIMMMDVTLVMVLEVVALVDIVRKTMMQ